MVARNHTPPRADTFVPRVTPESPPAGTRGQAYLSATKSNASVNSSSVDPMTVLQGWEKADRFSLLLLEEGEYYFEDFQCHYHPTKSGHRVAGHLKLCSNSMYFVPRNVMEPIFRVPFKATTAIERLAPAARPANIGERDECLEVTSSERVDMKMGNRNVPYISHKGNFAFHFSLSYSSALLERAQQLFVISQGAVEDRWGKIAELIKAHEESMTFDSNWLEDDEEIATEVVANRVTPLVSHPGRAVITHKHVYFQPFNVTSSSPVQQFRLLKATSVMLRHFNLEPIGLEIFFGVDKSLYLSFKSEIQRSKFHELLLRQPGLTPAARKNHGYKWVKDWQTGRVSNYDYLMWLNREAERSFNDLTQYPVFPWVITDHTSDTLDLKAPRTFRDLSKPIGALNPKRLEMCRRRYEDMLEANADLDDDNPMKTPPFLYGCHYSNPGFVVYFLLRQDPQLMLRLQNGKFDMPDRLMSGIAETFHSVMNNPTDLKELTPEFFTQPPTFLVNHEGLDFGAKQDGQRVGDVVLPPWAKSPTDFIHKMREALESEYVSKNLHKWIDLIFGYKQRGQAAFEADNVFHFLTYDDLGRRQLEKTTDPHLIRAIKLQMMEFGRMPKQLFTSKHPSRHSRSIPLRALFTCGVPREPDRLAKPVEGQNVILMRRQLRRVTIVRSKHERRQAMEWIEQESRELGPSGAESGLSLHSYVDLLPLVSMCRLADSHFQTVAVRVMHALALSKENCRLLLNAGAIEPIVDVLCSRHPQSTEVAGFLISRLVEVESPLLTNFNMSALAALLELMSEGNDIVRQAAAFAVCRLTVGELNRTNILALNGLRIITKLLSERYSVDIRTLAGETCVHLCLDDDTKHQLVKLGGLQLLIEMCEVKPLQVVAVKCLAVLSTNDRVKLDIAARGGLRLLSAASCASDQELQRAAADAVANMCTDTNIINAVVKEEGLWSVIAMAQSPNSVVQRHAARAFWHLAVHCENKSQIMDMGGLQTLVRLSMLSDMNPQATLLAEEALAKLSEDSEVKRAIERESLYAGKGMLSGRDQQISQREVEPDNINDLGQMSARAM